jgi:NAD(P)H dehydrogenase (quinone)
MDAIKLAIVYYSQTGTNYSMAETAADEARAQGAEVRLRKVAELAPASVIATQPVWQKHIDDTRHVAEATPDDLAWADAILFSVPTRFGNVASQLKQFLDTCGPVWSQGKLADKAVSAMATAMNPHGGQEATILSLYHTMYHWGAVVVTPGYTDPAFFKAGGNPYGTSATSQNGGPLPAEIHDAVRAQTRRLLQVASWLKVGRASLVAR